MEEKDKLRSKRFVEVIEELQISNQELKDKFEIENCKWNTKCIH